ncbi:hypothetical protein Pint_23970 [Pistacia integerrima]|uniref:Uncharacterized protein n=1 Tax=Pistacia integerrima TaxID=434235 RepID=A0ACC0YGV5_9ROSI|nr:hypothetical protein Pint_23970 [Pistacia integerrima]
MLCTSETAWGFFTPHFCLLLVAGFTLNFLKNLVEIQFYACNIVSVRSLCNAVNDMCCVNSSNGLKGQSNKRPITMDEVKQNKKEGSMWTVLKGRVYNLSPYMKFRPGGVDMLMKAVGKDSTSLFSILFWKFTCPHCFIEMTI